MGQFQIDWLTDDAVLARFRAALVVIFGDRIECVVLFGSRARGDGRADSDYDIALFLHGFVDRWRELDLLVPLVTDIVEETGAVVPHDEAAAAIDTAILFVDCIEALLVSG